MKRLPLIIGIVLGAGVGLLTSLGDSTGLQVVMMSIGAVAGAAIGGALLQVPRNKPLPPPEDAVPGLGFSPEDRMKRYWLEEGRLTSAPGIPGRDQQNP